MATEAQASDQPITLTKGELQALIDSSVQAALSTHLEGTLPPDCYRGPDGQLYRDKVGTKTYEVADPEVPNKTIWKTEEFTQHRHVSLDFREAQLQHWDFFHPTLGWVNEGYKLEQDRAPQEIFRDGSVGQMRYSAPGETTTSDAASLYRRPMSEGE